MPAETRGWQNTIAGPGRSPTGTCSTARARWLGVVETPAAFVIHDIGEEYVLGVCRDEFDVDDVQLCALDKPGPPAEHASG